MKTVKELIEFLNTLEQDMPIQSVYDGYQHSLNIYKFEGKVCFSSATYNPDYDEAEILFESERTND